ncbi:MAG TPA: radical SAM protein [Thermodesulfobacteriota bacterium]|jgi:radical SAM protein with 4Fe4S-binding SPASM domain|nr:radical SAM protein [Thermodesulfobacteriota bacterium]
MEKPSLRRAVQIGTKLFSRGDYTLTFDQLEFPLRNLPFRKRLNFLIQGMQWLMRPVHRFGFPLILQIEPTNICNLKCATCASGAGIITRSPSFMPFDLYRKVIDQVKDYVCLLVFWSWGEPFLHRDAIRMIRYAKDKGLLVHTSTNGHFFNTRELACRVIESGLDSLIVAVDGLDQPTYEKYRKGGMLNVVLKSIENLVSERDAAGVEHPRITFRFIVMRHNEHQVGRVLDFAERLGVDVVTFRAPVVRRGSVDLEGTLTPLYNEFQRYNYSGLPAMGLRLRHNQFSCRRPYANLTIFSNGDVVPCENDYNGTLPLGNVGSQSLHDIISSTKSRSFFQVFRRDFDKFPFCRGCEVRDMKYPTSNVRTHVLNRKCLKYEKVT